MEQFPNLLPTLNLTESTAGDPANRQRIMENWAILFDKVFFRSNILSRTGPLIYTLPPTEAGVSDAISWFNKETKEIHLNLDNDKTMYDNSDSEYTYSLVGALLHEMLHAFFYFYSDIEDQPAAIGGEGKNGHGPVWADCMIILQDWLHPAVNWTPCCEIGRAVRNSMEDEDWEATPEQLNRWRIA
jgi:hypothetical protein